MTKVSRAMYKALEESRCIWRDRAKGVKNDEPCPLCLEASKIAHNKEDCVNCPFVTVLGKQCQAFDYHEWVSIAGETGEDDPRAMKLANKMLQVIEQLLYSSCPADMARNCYIYSRGDDNWKTSDLPAMDGYAIVPLELYEQLIVDVQSLSNKLETEHD